MAPHILVVHSSNWGHTTRIAECIARTLEEAGCMVTSIPVDRLHEPFFLDGFDGVVIAAPVIRDRHDRRIERFVRAHWPELNELPGAFFSVSLRAASKRPEAPALARQDIAAFLRRTGWQPLRTHAVAGEIACTRYHPLLRFVMRRMCAKAQLSTDTSRDHDYMDRAEVARAARAFAVLVQQLKRYNIAARYDPLGPTVAVSGN